MLHISTRGICHVNAKARHRKTNKTHSKYTYMGTTMAMTKSPIIFYFLRLWLFSGVFLFSPYPFISSCCQFPFTCHSFSISFIWSGILFGTFQRKKTKCNRLYIMAWQQRHCKNIVLKCVR